MKEREMNKDELSRKIFQDISDQKLMYNPEDIADWILSNLECRLIWNKK